MSLQDEVEISSSLPIAIQFSAILKSNSLFRNYGLGLRLRDGFGCYERLQTRKEMKESPLLFPMRRLSALEVFPSPLLFCFFLKVQLINFAALSLTCKEFIIYYD